MQVWVTVILVPVNVASLAFVAELSGPFIALLAIGGMVPNVFLMLQERGLSKAMAWPHIFIWTPLLFIIFSLLQAGQTPGFTTYLWILLAVDLVSLGFDYPDAWRWWRGDRAVA